VAKGAKVVRFDAQQSSRDSALILKHVTGPTGNLRAPTIRCGDTLVVGFNADLYDEVLNGA